MNAWSAGVAYPLRVGIRYSLSELNVRLAGLAYPSSMSVGRLVRVHETPWKQHTTTRPSAPLLTDRDS